MWYNGKSQEPFGVCHFPQGVPVKRNARITVAVLLLTLLLTSGAAGSSVSASSLISGFSAEAGRATLTLYAAAYDITHKAEGHHIEMEAFGHLMVPGKPQLPLKRFTVALPPGARAQSVEILDARTAALPGTYWVEPHPPILPLADSPRFSDQAIEMRREWQANRNAVYTSDEPYPECAVWLCGSGTLRKYSYATVGFCPFTYHPLSGSLLHHDEISIVITYTLPRPGSADASLVHNLILDRVADERASRIFANYHEVAHLYQTDAVQPEPLTQTYDYIIITTGDLVTAITASAFPTWKASLGYSLKTVLTTDSEIANQPGGDLAEQIRNFLRAYYATWGIEYVLMVGDYATVPMRICYPNPDFHVYDPSDPGLVAPGTPNDYYYADLSFADSVSWDSDRDGYAGEYGDDSPDFLAEVAVGRIPVNDTARITYTLDKLVAFEQATGAWKTNALLAGAILFFENQDYSGYPFVDGATCLDSIGTGLMAGWTITRLSEQSGLVTSLFPWPALTEASFNTAWRTGEYAIVNWSGHGWCDGAYRTVWDWDDGDGVPESGNGEMHSYRFVGLGGDLDDDRPSIVFAISCNVGYPDPNPYGNLGIDLLTLPGWGPSAGIVSSSRPAAVSGDWKANQGGTESICYEFNRYMITHGELVGDALYDGKFYATTNYGWDYYYEYMNLYNFNLYGDPALAVDRATAGVVDTHGRGQDAVLRLEPSRPNPFVSATTLRFGLSAPARVTITVCDVRGRRVATLTDRSYGPGRFEVRWDGTDDRGGIVGSGIYFAAVETAGRTVVRKMVCLR